MYHLSQLFPSKKDHNIKIYVKLHMLFVMVVIFIISTVWGSALFAQQIHNTNQHTFLFSPFSWINETHSSLYFIDSMNKSPFRQSASPCLYVYPFPYLLQGWSTSTGFYPFSLFLPPFITSSSGYPYMYSWLFPFLVRI